MGIDCRAVTLAHGNSVTEIIEEAQQASEPHKPSLAANKTRTFDEHHLIPSLLIVKDDEGEVADAACTTNKSVYFGTREGEREANIRRRNALALPIQRDGCMQMAESVSLPASFMAKNQRPRSGRCGRPTNRATNWRNTRGKYAAKEHCFVHLSS